MNRPGTFKTDTRMALSRISFIFAEIQHLLWNGCVSRTNVPKDTPFIIYNYNQLVFRTILIAIITAAFCFNIYHMLFKGLPSGIQFNVKVTAASNLAFDVDDAILFYYNLFCQCQPDSDAIRR